MQKELPNLSLPNEGKFGIKYVRNDKKQQKS